MKSFEEMAFSERIVWAKGTILIGIGKGEFSESVAHVIMAVTQEAYQRGCKDTQQSQKSE